MTTTRTLNPLRRPFRAASAVGLQREGREGMGKQLMLPGNPENVG